jgi:elongation factor P
MLSYTDVTKGKIFVMNGEPHEVLEYAFLRMQQRRPTTQVKLRNLITGKISTQTFQQSDSFQEADIEKEPIIFIYFSKEEYYFHKKTDKSARFSLKEEILGDKAKFLKPNIECSAHKFNDKIINLELPIKIDYLVKEAPPSYKGDTATGGSKSVILENGLTINVPMFINEGDVIRVNTQTGEYTERVEKK